MLPHMSAAERSLFDAFVANARQYGEFGSGGSTYAACSRVKSSVISVDSSAEWQTTVRMKCADDQLPIVPTLVHVDIGRIGEWGTPTDETTKERWPSYYTDVWQTPGLSQADLYMVDGRFRVACFMQILLRCDDDALIMFHDYASRKAYHVVGDVARQVASVDDLSVFMPLRGRSRARINELLSAHAFSVA